MQNLQPFYNILIASFLVSISLISCGDSEPEQRITGGVDAEVLNLQDSTIHIFSEVLPLDFIKGEKPNFEEYIEVDSNGIFMYPYVFQEGYYIFEFDKNKIKYFIQEGKRLSVDFNAKTPANKPEFSGKLKYESRYLFDKHLVLAKFESNLPFHLSLPESEFLDVLNLLRNKLDKMLVMYITNRPIGSEYFMKQESLSNFYYVASIIEKYKIQHTGMVSDTVTQLTEKLSMNDTNAIENPEFFSFLVARVWAEAGLPNSQNAVYNQLTVLDSLVSREEYRNYVLFKTTREVAKMDDSDARNELIDTLLYSVTDRKVKNYLIQNLVQDTLTVQVNDSLNTILE